MLYLTEISIARQQAIDACIAYDPLACEDIRACAKTWMAARPSLACRPWSLIEGRNGMRLVGWRSQPGIAPQTDAPYLATRAYQLKARSRITLAGCVAAVRRCESRCHDAARDRRDKEAAYGAWIAERLLDLQPDATVERIEVIGHATETGLRKARDASGTRAKAFARVAVPMVRAEITLTVHDPERIEAWLLSGMGPHKAFGYGAFIPTAGS